MLEGRKLVGWVGGGACWGRLENECVGRWFRVGLPACTAIAAMKRMRMSWSCMLRRRHAKKVEFLAGWMR